ncbi:cis-3-hydroxy-L-proline dehydratase [Paracoccus jeotgali]|uniref:2-methyl-cis-aconitate hydratase n=1 Tax=Paracoccus jeotgali TaxID=2065379 RepID=A0A2K9MHM2_9RHOB|nr:aconitase family protein [Paracoccus jeotgali]AUM74972.1 hypothetical protein CYR75_12385 [Paracoccus jeotgali]
MTASRILPGTGRGPVLAMQTGLSFWGGVDPDSGRVIDAQHPACGEAMAGRVVLMPNSRGSCSGSGTMLELALNGCAPAALIFAEHEDVATLGALVAALVFDRPVPVLRAGPKAFTRLSRCDSIEITEDAIIGHGADPVTLPLTEPAQPEPALSPTDRAVLAGEAGPAAALAMQVILRMARLQGASRLIDVTRGHVDGTILANQANLIFAEKLAAMGAQVRIPTTINAISVDRQNWQQQGVPPVFGGQAARLADAYTAMGCRPSFTCAPYQLDDLPKAGEMIAWAESNAVVYANTVLGARTPKHPDYLDLCIALTGRAPLAGVYLDAARRPGCVLQIAAPDAADDALWPLVGHLAGLLSPDAVPLLRGLEGLKPSTDDLRAICAAFGTTSAAPMLHVAGVTPEAHLPPLPEAPHHAVSRDDLARAWQSLNHGPGRVDLVAIGSPHASARECRRLAALLDGQRVQVPTIVTTGRGVIAELADGTAEALHKAGVQLLPDLCWCSMTEPVFPPDTTAVMTNSGKYAHYGPGLSGRKLRFGSLRDCAQAALTERAADLPEWLRADERTA